MEMPILAVLQQCSRQLLCFTPFDQYFLLNKVRFLLREWYLAAILSLLPFCHFCHFVTFAIFSYKRGIYAQNGVFGE
jgi:hypothetical protein